MGPKGTAPGGGGPRIYWAPGQRDSAPRAGAGRTRTLSALYSVRWARTGHLGGCRGVGGRLPNAPFLPALWGTFR